MVYGIMSNLIHTDIERVLELGAAGASVRTIASMTGISKSTVSRILRGERLCDGRSDGDVGDGEHHP